MVFDLDADLTRPAAFYDLPYPSDLRLQLDGRPDLGDDLFGEAAVGRGEGLPLAMAGVHGLGERHPLDRPCRAVGIDGKMYDRPHLERARRLLTRAGANTAA